MFGDSFSVPFKRIENEHPYVPYKGYCPKIFSNILSEELNLNLVDMSNGGCSNYSILHTYIKNIDKIEPIIEKSGDNGLEAFCVMWLKNQSRWICYIKKQK